MFCNKITEKKTLMIKTPCAICGTYDNSVTMYEEKLGNEAFDWYTFSARRSFDAESRIHYRVVKCKTCGLVRSDPILEPDKIFNLYKKSELIYEEEMEDIGDTYLGYLNKAARYIKNKGLILEIGCGNGFFLKKALDLGFKDARGVEPGLSVLERAPRELRNKIVADVFKEGLFPHNSFDMVCIFQTLDHLIKPGEMIGEIFKILKPGGVILALNHDVESFSAKVMGERSPIFDVQHIYLFNKKTQTAIFLKNHFQIREIFNVWNSYRLRYWLKLAPIKTSIKKIISRILIFLRLWNLKIPLRAGNLAVIAQKPNEFHYKTSNGMNNYRQDDNYRPDISLVILCYKAGEPIRQFCRNAIKIFTENRISDYELVLVGNYHKNSHDETPRVVAELADENPRISCVTKEKEGMMGWDMRSGLNMARGDYIAVIDGDGQMPLEDVVAVYGKIKNEQLDLVKTYRIKRGDSRWRKIISEIYNLFFRFLFPGLCSRDINSKPKIFSRMAYKRLNLVSNDWFADAEIMIQARRLHFKIGEVPTYFLGLSGNRRSFVHFSAIAEFIKNLIIFRLKEFKYWFK